MRETKKAIQTVIVLLIVLIFGLATLFQRMDFSALFQFAKELNEASVISYPRIIFGICVALLGAGAAMIFFQIAKRREKMALLKAEELLFTKTEIDFQTLIDSIKEKDCTKIARILSLLETQKAFKILEYLHPAKKAEVMNILMERYKNNDHFSC